MHINSTSLFTHQISPGYQKQPLMHYNANKSTRMWSFNSQQRRRYTNTQKSVAVLWENRLTRFKVTKKQRDWQSWHDLQHRNSISFPSTAERYTGARLANLVQSITWFDATICLCCHINCFGSVRGNIVSCPAPLCCLTLCSTAERLQVAALPEWWCLPETLAKT